MHRSGNKYRLTVVASLAVSALALAACGSAGTGGRNSEGGSAEPSSSQTVPTDTSSPSDEADAAKDIVIGWSQRGITGSDWWKTLIQGGQDAATAAGARIELLDANRDTTQQNQDVQTLISKGVDVVIINPNDPLGVSASVKALKEAGIPLVVVNSNLDDSLVPDQFCYVAEDQVATGALAGEVIAKKAIDKFGTSGEWKLVGVGGYPGDVISELRYKGFMQGYNKVLKDYPDVKTVELEFRYGHWLPDQALSPMRDIATANPDLKIIYSESDVMQAGIQQALEQAGIWGDGILEGSYDGGMATIKQMIDDPNGPLQADASNQPYDQGAAAVEMAIAAVKGDASACPGGTKYIETTVVTPENAANYYVAEDTYVRAQH